MKEGVVPYKRNVWVYVPKQYGADTPVPFIIAQDGGGYVKTLIPALDTLIHEKRVPVMAMPLSMSMNWRSSCPLMATQYVQS